MKNENRLSSCVADKQAVSGRLRECDNPEPYPESIWCPYCLADWPLLPGEYEAILDGDYMPECPLCGNPLEFVMSPDVAKLFLDQE